MDMISVVLHRHALTQPWQGMTLRVHVRLSAT
jgi:hypothetical protein